MKKIGIVVAQQKECEGLMKKLGKYEKIDLYGGFSVKMFRISDKEIFFAESGVGEIRAAAATQRLIDAFSLDVIINFGVAGGLKKNTRGNIYVIKGVCHYDFDTTPLVGAGRGKYECFDSAVLKTDEEISELALSLYPSAELAICASGDKFISDETIKGGLVDEFSASVCEMEAAGVVITATLCGVRAAVIKIISDDSAHAEEYENFLSEMTDELNDLIIGLIKKI